MIPQLVWRLKQKLGSDAAARKAVLEADPLDLVLHLEQVWNAAEATPPDPARIRNFLASQSAFGDVDPRSFPPGPPAPPVPFRPWDHLGASYVLENTRVVQIMRRV